MKHKKLNVNVYKTKVMRIVRDIVKRKVMIKENEYKTTGS